jgi:hypothetical protein
VQNFCRCLLCFWLLVLLALLSQPLFTLLWLLLPPLMPPPPQQQQPLPPLPPKQQKIPASGYCQICAVLGNLAGAIDINAAGGLCTFGSSPASHLTSGIGQVWGGSALIARWR